MTEHPDREPPEARDRFPDAPSEGDDLGTDEPPEATGSRPVRPMPGAIQANPGGPTPDEQRGEIPTGRPDPTVGPD
ncbi:hypothetical protein [Phytohabitans suffuscus]|uniref:Uncharacterized protein n=1 Tax=Phytohabitans suffuscus TaxID=624315 RepID=A0A6F8YV86_9ACTN|nr:hypothetical protein [Phytohabitans suffuscus]BCB90070.1 hypothetical protein Psuf_073830 [Phytohabitans suffuscus]